MRAEQITGPVVCHGEGPVWSESWGGLRWVSEGAQVRRVMSMTSVGWLR